MNKRAGRKGSGTGAFRAVEAMESRLLMSTYTVTSAADAGIGSLRQAILDANLNPGADAIHFAIPTGGSIARITAITPLPTITDTVALNATTQSGYFGPPIVELVASSAGSQLPVGLHVTSTGSVIRGLAIQRFSTAVKLEGTGNQIAGCYLGLNAAGAKPSTQATAVGVLVGGTDNLVGGLNAGDRNVASGNGVGIFADGVRYRIQGNWIGLAVTGSAALPNNIGVRAIGTNGLIGGTVSAARNVISGNTYAGINMNTGTALSADGDYALKIQGNYVGTNAAGTSAVANGYGMDLSGDAVLVGGTASGMGNLISGNDDDGILLSDSSGSAIQGNSIGVTSTGTALGNGRVGIWLIAASNTLIGGTGAAGNIIANSRGPAVAVGARNQPYGSGNTISGNSIYENLAAGIDLGSDGNSGIDPLDTDTGANGAQNAPWLGSATSSGSAASVSGSLFSRPLSTYTIEWFASPWPTQSYVPQGKVLLGSQTVTTNAAGEATLSWSFVNDPANPLITATATADDGSTSELSNYVEVNGIAAPKLHMAPSNPVIDPASDTGVSQTDGITNDNTPTFVGKAPPNAIVVVQIDGTTAGSTVADADGVYRFTTEPQADKNSAVVQAYVSSGSVKLSGISSSTVFSIDTQSPTPAFFPAGNSPKTEPMTSIRVWVGWQFGGPAPGAIQLFRDGVPLLPSDYVPRLTTDSFILDELTELTRPGGQL